MPNGESKNWIRLINTLLAFHSKHGCWPTRVAIPAGCLEDIEGLISADELAEVQGKLTLESGDLEFVALDDEGRTAVYGDEIDTDLVPKDVEAWLGVSPDFED